MNDASSLVEDPVYCLAASPAFSKDGICFAARTSGLILSNDGGVNWENAYASLGLRESLSTTAVCLSPNFTKEKHVFAGVPGGILCSLDGGKNWRKAIMPTPPPVISVLAASPNYSQDRTLFAGTMEDGFLLSINGGESWHPWNFGLLDPRVMALAISPGFAQDETIFAATETGIFRSDNNGRSWKETGFEATLAPVLSLAISPDFTQDGTLFAGTMSNGLFKSSDEGQTWKRLDTVAIPNVVNTILISDNSKSKAEMLVLVEEQLLVSQNGGEVWSELPINLPEGDGPISVVAPGGLVREGNLLVGTQNGTIITIVGISFRD